MSTATYHQFTLRIFLFFVVIGLVGCQSTAFNKKTDTVTRLAIRYLNEHKPDSVYQLFGNKVRKHITPAYWASSYKEKMAGLLPLTNIAFVTGNDSVSIYKMDGKMPLNCYISLDKQNKINWINLLPYQESIKPVSVNADEREIDVLARKVIDLINHKQADSAYLLAGDDFKSKISTAQWRDFLTNTTPVTSNLPAVLIDNKWGSNVYAMGSYRFIFGSLKEGKFNQLNLQRYEESALKTKKVSTDNKLSTHIDSLVDKAVSAYIQIKGNVGLSAGVFYKGNSYFYNYGERKKDQNILPTQHTLYDVGSITKTFTSTLLAIAVNQKKVTLETPITQYLPDSVATNPALKKITFKELANHTSGLPREPDDMARTITDANQRYGNYGNKEMFSFLKHFKQVREPGTKYEYSNLAVGLLGLSLEQIYHKPYAELIRNYITTPLKMNETMVAIDTLKYNNLAQGYDELITPVPFFNLVAFRSAGAIKSSTSDLLTYAKAQWAAPDSILSKGLNLTHQVTFNNGSAIVGLVWNCSADDQKVLQHSGATGGYRSNVSVDLNKQIAVVVLTNNASTGDVVGGNLMKAIQAIK